MSNFVLHNKDLESHQNADVDILAVRPKYVDEGVGRDHRDEWLFNHFNLDKNIGLICEVKSGNHFRSEIYMGREDRLKYALKRIGFFGPAKTTEYSQKLINQSVVAGRYHQVGKILFTHYPRQEPGFICINLEQVQSFLLDRIQRFPNEKSGAKLFFDSELLQYMIWNSTRR
ncbi:hypothetical protein [Paenibacillus lutrae]|uniref:Uncharacterized protein n=1 Tax=Paenibacillus lutrae TaxID=2078573 RepID=A0A7X3FJZ3_9BACL|nr:hypothetical protein [Paenibacillus lutrae]MVP01023.1 hypothetical protein [Paenibacillus lutrae]